MSTTTPRRRQTVARHGELASPHPFATVLKVLGIVLAVALVSGATVVLLGLVTGVGTGWVHALGVPDTVQTPLSITVPVTAVAVVLALVGTGAWSAHLGGTPKLPAVLRNVGGGLLAMAVTYAAGRLIGTHL